MDYAFTHEGRNYTPNQTAGITDAAEHNKAQELAEIEWLKTAPERVFLYIGREFRQGRYVWGKGYRHLGTVQTWLGTVLDPNANFGQVCNVPAFGGWPSKRRSVECRIFGVRYVGWYYESSGDYCRLKKAKRQ